MRRTVLSLLATAALLSSACGGEESAKIAAGGAAAGADASAFPVTIEHKFGATTIEQPPKRVLTVGYTEQDTILALGVTPVGVRNFLGGYEWKTRPWAADVPGAKGVQVVADQEIDFEAVVAQRPDLIVAINSGMKRSDYDKLSRIAPTIAQSGDVVDYGMPWQEQTLVIGRALGLEAKAKELVAGVEAKFEAVKQANPAFAESTAILAYGGPDGYGAYTTQDTRSRFLSDLGLTLPAAIDRIAGDSFFTELSQERFRLIDEDLVIMYGPQDEIESDPVFSRLDAVKEGRVVYLDFGDQAAGALGFSSVLSLPWLLDQLAPELAKAIDGNPATKVAQPE